jgi:hypothetical protein
MDRRSFFKFLAASAAAVAVPKLALAEILAPTLAERVALAVGGKEYGMAVSLPGTYKDFASWTVEFLLDDARKYFPAGTVVEIRACIPTDYGRSHQAAWYTNKRIALSQPDGGHPLEMNRMGGYFSGGTYRL